MLEFKCGQIVKSIAGHDKNQLYLIKEIKDEYVYLVDGKIRKLNRTKKKKKKHISFIGDENIVISDDMTDAAIRRIIKRYK